MRFGLAAPAAALALIAAPAAGQQGAEGGNPKLRAHQDLQCAALYAVALGVEKDKAPGGSNAVGLASLVSFFVGRAAGADPEIDIKRDLNSTLYKELVGDMDAITRRCQADALKFGTDMKTAGQAMQDAARDK